MKNKPRNTKKLNLEDFRPSQFMRARRPELFSDSILESQPSLSPEQLEYHLETLTNRKQENPFEYFCRQLAEKEICPNLIPQTGPTGGGDSKVDAETYPVAEEISIRWYEGLGQSAGNERWAFAFSAKKNWRPKLRSDVENIAKTQRGYRLIYFITNQFVKDKDRAAQEDKLSKEHGVKVRILDRTWIVDRVLQNDRLELAAQSLHIRGLELSTRRRVGPRDTERTLELEELEKQIDDPTRYPGVRYQLIEDCLRSAELARGLERPRTEVEGRFSRAERVAEKFGSDQQRLRVAYARTWTAFWWYDDLSAFNNLYAQVERYAIDSSQVTDLELLKNVWQLLYGVVRRGQLDRKEAKLDGRFATLNRELSRIAEDKKRPASALRAKTNLLLVALVEAVDDQQQISKCLRQLKEILPSAEGLINYPLQSLTELIQELGSISSDSEEYDALLESLVKLTGKRLGEAASGHLLRMRGYQKLKSKKNYDAIRLLGRAQLKLGIHERRSECVSALAGCGVAYEAAGLLWAARANVLAAASLTLSEFYENGGFIPATLPLLEKLVWLELQLGRIPHVLAWMETAHMIASHLVLDEERKERFIEQRADQDMVLGLLLLKTTHWELKWLDFVPDVLDKLDLPYSRLALLYALGYEGLLREEGWIPPEEDHDNVHDFFQQWFNQPAGDDLPDGPEFLERTTVALRSFVLGCEIIVETANNPVSIQLAEAVLAVLESLLATSLDQEVLPWRSKFRVIVRPSDFVDVVPEYEIQDQQGKSQIEIRHSLSDDVRLPEQQDEFRRWLLEVVCVTVSQIAFVQNPEDYLKRLALDEAGLGRALSFADVTTFVKSILGDKPKFHLSDWKNESGAKQYPLCHSSDWHLRREKEKKVTQETKLTPGRGEPPEGLFGIDHIKHRHRRIFSLINIPLWDKARWKATGYIWSPKSEVGLPPMILIGFSEADPGKAIFKAWRDQLGEVDKEELLRVSIIAGIDQDRPAAYSVVIGSNPKFLEEVGRPSQFVTISRINRMDPRDSRNLDSFLEHFGSVSRYILVPGHFTGPSSPPIPFPELGIQKRELRVCPAWQLTEHDPDICAVREGDNLIIPSNVKKPPILRALQRIQERRSSDRR